VIVITAYQKVSPKLVILAPYCLCSARYTPIPPKIRINIARVAGITKPMFVFRNVKRRPHLIGSAFLRISKYK
jgi:hypothetical protein